MATKNPVDDLKEIRKMMETSSKFISLSGLSGVFAGLTALLGAWLASGQIKTFQQKWLYYEFQNRLEEGYNQLSFRLLLIAVGTFVLAVLGALFFTWLKARKQQTKLWTKLSVRMVISLAVPLVMGGLFIIALWIHGYPELIAPLTLLVYGMGLLNASKYVHADLKFLALGQMALGILSLFYLNNGILFWSIGFGAFHILYGLFMYIKYDRKQGSFE